MERERVKQEVRQNWRQLIADLTIPAQRKANGETSFICPICGHGKNGDGLTVNPKSRDGNGLKCFGCNFSGDIIDLYQKVMGVDYNTALSLLAQNIGLTVDQYRTNPTVNRHGENGSGEYRNTTGHQNGKQRAAERPTEVYFRECMERLNDPAAVSYLSARGISVGTAAAYGLGFDPKADPAQSGHTTPRLIIPTSSTHYIGRSTDPTTPKQFAKLNNKGGSPDVFNKQALYAQGVREVFVTEGVFDALSVIEAGAAAIALNSTSNAELLLKTLEENRTEATLILCLDNDSAGNKATDTLCHGLKRLNISYINADICGKYKDPNEHLTSDKDSFVSDVEQVKQRTAAKPDNTAYYIDHLMSGEISRFRDVKKTGFQNLDEQSGGLNTGLYAIAAISSLGKTTFAAQIADQLAAAGHDVLFFSLEQSRLELVSKSISRRTAQNDMATAVSSLAIRRGYLPPQVLIAAKEYAQDVRDHISIIEGNFSCNISFIGDYVRKYMGRTNTRPVVFVDYLQILQPEKPGTQSTREMVDSTVTELKRLSRELDLTVFVISSVNRANYLTPIDFESLKESGGIEYTCDCVWGLQLQCLNDDTFDKANNIKERREKIKEAKAATPRKIELVCLKNRYGVANFSCYFDYYPAHDLFTPGNEVEPPQRKANRRL